MRRRHFPRLTVWTFPYILLLMNNAHTPTTPQPSDPILTSADALRIAFTGARVWQTRIVDGWSAAIYRDGTLLDVDPGDLDTEEDARQWADLALKARALSGSIVLGVSR